MGPFLSPITPDEARRILGRFGCHGRIETVPLAAAAGRVLAADVVGSGPLPAFARAQMDGWAVRARDLTGASETQPAWLRIAGRVRIGEPPGAPLPDGAAVEVPTGGPVPPGADAVVMVEHSREAGDLVELSRAPAAGDHVLPPGADVPAGERLLARGRRLRPTDVAALAAAGLGRVAVLERPRVAVLSTGDELVPAGEPCPPGKVPDSNGPALCAQIAEASGEPRFLGIAGDEPAPLRDAVAAALPGSDLVLVSGGSSAGARDHTAAVLQELGPPGVLAHGIRVAPGKPTILGACGTVPVVGMPGHPVSSLLIFRIFLHPLVRALGGETGPCEPFPARRTARLARRVSSKPGREDHVRVRLDGDRAHPLLGQTGAVSTLLRADGVVVIPYDTEGLEEGSEVTVLLL